MSVSVDPAVEPGHHRAPNAGASNSFPATAAGLQYRSVDVMHRYRAASAAMSKSTLPSARLSRADVQRLRAQIVRTASCALWMGAVGSDGYGKFWVSTPVTTSNVDPAVRVRGGRVITSHAAVSALVFGPLPLGSTHLHDCDVRLCVNTHPGHLRRGTQREMCGRP